MVANGIFFSFNLNDSCLCYFGLHDFVLTITSTGADAQSHTVGAIGEASVPPTSLPLVMGPKYVMPEQLMQVIVSHSYSQCKAFICFF
jgi:hypothetical protein